MHELSLCKGKGSQGIFIVPRIIEVKVMPPEQAFKWFDYARRSMQRLGYLKLLVALAREAGPTTLEGLTRQFQSTITNRQRVPVEIQDRLRSYVSEHKLLHRYPTEAKQELLEFAEVQDLYLSDSDLNSSTGAITGEMDRKGYRHAVYVEIPPWAARLGFIKLQNYSLTDRGRALLDASPSTLDSFRTFNAVENPFRLSVAQRLIFLFAMVDADGDLLKHAYSRIVNRPGIFSREELGDHIADALADLRKEHLRALSTGRSLQLARKMSAVVESVRNQPRGGSYGPRESVATPRTEPLVDCGLLTKTARSIYSYELTEGGRRFLEALISAPSVEDFLTGGLAATAGLGFGVDRKPARQDEVLSRVAGAYKRLRYGLGYVSLREAAVFSIALALSDGLVGFEIADAERVVLDAARTYGRQVRLTQSRSGRKPLFRMDRDLLQTLAR